MVVLTGLLLPLASTAQAGNLYTENFIGNTPTGINVDQAGVGWHGGNWANLNGDTRVADKQANSPPGLWVPGGLGAFTYDGDFWYTARGGGDSGRMNVTTKVGEYTVLAADRIDTEFQVDWASSTQNGARFLAMIDGMWYGSDKFGTGSGDHGAQTGRNVTEWAADQTVNLESDTWYAWPGVGNEASLSSTALTGLPGGDITQFGMWWNNTNNSHAWAIDNFRVNAVGASETYVWVGGAPGNWGDGNWAFGGTSSNTPATGSHMFIDADTDDSDVTVNADFISALSVNVGMNNLAALTVAASRTLEATKVNLGSQGTLDVSGTLTAPALVSSGVVTVSGTVNASALVQVADGSLTSSSTGALNIGTGTLSIDGGTGATLDGPLSITGGTVALNGGTLTYNNATAATPAVLALKGGTLAGTGTVAPTVRYEVHDASVSDLTGAGVGLVATGTVELTGTNDYTGDTEVRGATATATLRVADVTDLGVGNLFLNSQGRYQQDARNRPAILETQGTLTRTIGPGAGEISFATPSGERSAASFAAVGGPLVVDMNGGTGATIDWSASTSSGGLQRMHLEFGSVNATDVVTFKNGLDMTNQTQYLYTIDNPASEDDYGVIEGVISSTGTGRLNKRNAGKLVFTGDNTYTGETYIDQGTLLINGDQSAATGIVTARDRDGVTLGGSGTIGGAVTVNNRATLSPGASVGTLTIAGAKLELAEGSIYEFELGAPSGASLQDGNDLVAVVAGDLDLQGAWKLQVSDTDGYVAAFTDHVPLFTYAGSLIGLGDPTITHTLPLGTGEGEWQIDAGGLQVSDDGVGIVYLTGLSGGIPVFPTLPGDANNNGFVDDDDLAILLSNWESDPGTITTWALGDFTADTDVDDDDLAVLLGNWTGPAPGGAAVPEPATLALLGLGGLSVIRRRRK